MAIFHYKTINSSGKVVKNKIDATSLRNAQTRLQNNGVYILSITPAKKALFSFQKSTNKSLSKSKLPQTVITQFIKELSVLVSTSIPYDKALEVLLEETDNVKFQSILSEIKAQILEGSSLANAIAKYPQIFPTMEVAMIRSGEEGGNLGAVLLQIAAFKEEAAALRSKVQGAMIYPIIMMVLGVVIVIFMMTFILPKILPIFSQFKVKLPLPTRIVMFMSDSLIHDWPIILIVIGALIVFANRFSKTKKGRFLIDRFALLIPVFGAMQKKLIIYRFTQTLGTMLKNSVDMQQALDIVMPTLGNKFFEKQLEVITDLVTKKGLDLSQALRQTNLFPNSVLQMIRVGETTSRLESMLQSISTNMEKDVKQTIDRAISLLEPALILGMSAGVGFIVLAVMLPMFQLNQLL